MGRRTLYRTLGAAVILILLGAALAPAAGQFRRKRGAHKMRAIGVLMWPASGKGVPTLAPLVILSGGRYYDASAYLASPVPLSAQPGTVYEGQRSGLPVGLFTIHSARELNRSWLGLGTWHEGIETPKPATASRTHGRSGESGDDERPILRKREGTTTPPAAKPPGAGAPAASSTPAQAPQPAAPAPASSEEPAEDPDRPVLRRGAPAKGASEEIPAEIAKATRSTPMPLPGATAPPVPPAPRIMVAVSDAQPGEERSFLLAWSKEEEAQLTQKTTALAQQEIQEWASLRQQARGPWPLADLQVKFFDLQLDNYPDIVLTARQPVAAAPARTGSRGATAAHKPKAEAGAAPAPPLADVYITLVARSDLDGNLHTLFSSITDARHLDATPRLELVDAVDADGEGFGELLFHKIWGASSPLEGNVVLYRVGPDRLTELFDSSGQ